ncbi:MAG: DNA polymerase III subunit gamma/tau, partial [Candidatus Margulisiibacteriota bacterium]
LAKALNCEKGPTPDPCGLCPQCEKIKNGHSVNVIEIDAASNRGIDEIRELRERIRYAPVEGRYKVYIIDEVHMLTPEAFNALLKTLEEPPSNTIFILATTELQKVPLTIISRCQRLDFSRIKLVEIEKHLNKIARAEKWEVDAKALGLIARAAEGCMRDAVSLLDQLSSFAGDKITYDDVVMMLGTADEELLFAFSDALGEGDTVKILDLVRKGVEEGRSVLQVTRDLLYHFRNLLHLKVGSGEALELTADYLERIKQQSERFALARIKEVMRALSRAELDMKWHPHARLVLEVALLELLGDRQPTARGEVRREVTKSETVTVVRQTVVVPPPQMPAMPASSNNGQLGKIKSQWEAILDSVKKKTIFGYVSLHEGEPMEINERGKLVIAFHRGYSFHKERLEDAKNKTAVEDALQEIIGEKIIIESVVMGEKKEAGITANAVAELFEGRVLK